MTELYTHGSNEFRDLYLSLALRLEADDNIVELFYEVGLVLGIV